MTTIVNRVAVREIRIEDSYRHDDGDTIVAALSDPDVGATQPCAFCGALALYEGQACADRAVLMLCRPCLDAAIHRLRRMRDNAKLATGYEPVCNRCWRPILDPDTHVTVRPLWE